MKSRPVNASRQLLSWWRVRKSVGSTRYGLREAPEGVSDDRRARALIDM